MSKYRFFQNKNNPRCSICFHGTLSVDCKTILCPKKGVTDLNYHCWRFKYSPLKHIPASNPVAVASYSEEDFKL